jgi:hypothetical protein
MAPICMQGQRREKHTYTALLPGTPSQPAHEEESPPHTPHLSKTALPLGMPDLSGMKRARKRRGRKKYNEPKQSAHLELSPPQTADIVSATRTSQTLRPITFAQVHHFAAVGHPVAALAFLLSSTIHFRHAVESKNNSFASGLRFKGGEPVSLMTALKLATAVTSALEYVTFENA